MDNFFYAKVENIVIPFVHVLYVRGNVVYIDQKYPSPSEYVLFNIPPEQLENYKIWIKHKCP